MQVVKDDLTFHSTVYAGPKSVERHASEQRCADVAVPEDQGMPVDHGHHGEETQGLPDIAWLL